MSDANLSPRRLAIVGFIRWMLIIAVTAVATSTMLHFWGHAPGASASPQGGRYWCPMHHQVRSEGPGTCPICHMALVPIDDAPEVQGGHDAHDHPPPDGGSPGALEGVVPVTLTLDRVQRGGVSSVAATAGSGDEGLTVPAVVEAPERAVAQVHLRAPGFIEAASVRETGVRVSAGQVLARVYQPSVLVVQQELLAALRFEPGGGPVSPHGLGGISEPAQLVATARSNLLLLGMSSGDIDAVLRTRTAMRAVPVRAPIAGYITRHAAVPGAYITPEATLYEVTDLSRVWVIASVPTEHVASIRRGAMARFAADDGAGEELSARVTLIDPNVSLATRSARVRLELPNPRMALRPGQWGRARFSASADAGVSPGVEVPRDAVIDTGDAQYVFVDQGGGRFDPRRVTVGPARGERLAILEGLRVGERVVARGAFMIDSESRLRASLTEAPVDGGAP